jgi:membrane protein
VKSVLAAMGSAKRVYADFFRSDGTRLAAAVAYAALFAFGPLLVVSAKAARAFVSTQQAGEAILRLLSLVEGPEAASKAAGPLTESIDAGLRGAFGTVGTWLLLLAVVGAFIELQYALNRMWRVRTLPDLPWTRLLAVRAPRLVLVLLPSILLVAASLGSSMTAWASTHLRLGGLPAQLDALGSPVALAVATWLALVLIYRWMPDARVHYADVVVPALVVAVVWVFGTDLYGLYLTTVGSQSLAGAEGAVVLLFVWLNYSAQALLLGGWWCRLRAEARGPVEPLEHASVDPVA